jgi:hypothetical protein
VQLEAVAILWASEEDDKSRCVYPVMELTAELTEEEVILGSLCATLSCGLVVAENIVLNSELYIILNLIITIYIQCDLRYMYILLVMNW